MKKLHLTIISAVFLIVLMMPKTVNADTAYGYLLLESSSRIYSEEELCILPAQVMCYARAEIYARCGSMFSSGELQSYFSQQYWYTALYQPGQLQDDMLNLYEQSNSILLGELLEQAGGYLLDQPGYSAEAVYEYIDTVAQQIDTWQVDADSYIFYDSDRRLLTEDDLDPVTAKEAAYADKEILARHGAIFTSQELSEYFSQKNWYWAQTAEENIQEDILNVYEQQNRQLLQNALQDKGGYLFDEPGFTYEGIGSYTGLNNYSDYESQYIFWDSNIRYLTEEEIRALSLRQICYARNEIYARRGYIFQSQELRDYFQSKSWYKPSFPSDQFSTTIFNSYEIANIDLLAQIEYSEDPDGYSPY